MHVAQDAGARGLRMTAPPAPAAAPTGHTRLAGAGAVPELSKWNVPPYIIPTLWSELVEFNVV